MLSLITCINSRAWLMRLSWLAFTRSFASRPTVTILIIIRTGAIHRLGSRIVLRPNTSCRKGDQANNQKLHVLLLFFNPNTLSANNPKNLNLPPAAPNSAN
jgi:hypothetical protein